MSDTEKQRWTIQTDDGGGPRTVEVEVNFRRIAAHLGWRAFKNRSGKSSYLEGAVVVRKV